MQIANKVAVVTGGGSGIGRGIALALAETGADVVIADIDFERAQTVAKEVRELSRRAAAFRCDVTREESVEALADFAWREMGHVELAFNNAGIVAVGMATDATVADLRWTYDVNVYGVWYGSLAFARRFLEKDVKGWICNTGSENALAAASIGTSIYTGAKHAVLGMTDTLRSEYAGKIGFSVLCPGIVNTEIWNAGRNRSSEYGGEFKGDAMNERAITGFGLSPELVGRHVVASIEKEEFYILTHPHVRDAAEQRWKEIAAAMDRQWPEGAGPEHFTTLDVQKKAIEGQL
jgi:meso-butanediol dehydrogenase/(S,S)-butanediol dehydrogenase/diacetyl reductase